MQYFTQVHFSLFFRVMDSIIIQEVKVLTKKSYFIILSRRKIRNVSLRFIVRIILHSYGLHYNTRTKRVNDEIVLCFTVQEEDQFLCKISGSLFTLFTCFYMVVACIIMYCQQQNRK